VLYFKLNAAYEAQKELGKQAKVKTAFISGEYEEDCCDDRSPKEESQHSEDYHQVQNDRLQKHEGSKFQRKKSDEDEEQTFVPSRPNKKTFMGKYGKAVGGTAVVLATGATLYNVTGDDGGTSAADYVSVNNKNVIASYNEQIEEDNIETSSDSIKGTIKSDS
jgi:hypothetical protein